MNFSGAVALQTTAWLVIAWVLLFWCWRLYRIDILRQRLFELRDELFDFAAEGHITFSDEVYIQNRIFLNAMIRYAHRMTFTRAIIGTVFARTALSRIRTPAQLIPELPAGATKDKLFSIHQRANAAVFLHLVTGSPLPVFALGGLVVSLVIKGVYRAYSEKLGSDRTVAAIERLAILAEATA